MKPLITATAALAFVFCPAARAEHSTDEKAEMKRIAEEFRKCAAENKAAALDECEASAPEIIKAAANNVVARRRSLGELDEQLATAYEAGDQKAINRLHKLKAAAELDCELAEKEKRVAYVMNNVDELLREMPGSAEAAQLKQKTEAEIKEYLENSKKLLEAEKAQMVLENKMEAIDSKIEIIRKKEELRQLEAETE